MDRASWAGQVGRWASCLREVVWGGGSALWVRMGGVGGGFALSSVQSDFVFHSLPCGKSIIIMS